MPVKTEQTTVPVYRFFCDVCGEEIPSTSFTPQPCKLCGRYVCDRHAVRGAASIGDYSDFYCWTCWEAGYPMRVRIEELERQCDAAEEALMQQWENAAARAVEAEKGQKD